MEGKRLLVVFVVAAAWLLVEATHKIMTDLTLGFGQALEHCREESGLTNERMEEFFHVWERSFKFEERELGCALRCMNRYFNLYNEANKLAHEKTETFIKSFPNGEVLAQQLMKMIQQCEKRFDGEQDDCMRTLRMGECVRDLCLDANLAPSVEMLLAEFIMQAEG